MGICQPLGACAASSQRPNAVEAEPYGYSRSLAAVANPDDAPSCRVAVSKITFTIEIVGKLERTGTKPTLILSFKLGMRTIFNTTIVPPVSTSLRLPGVHDTGFHAGPYSGIRSAVDNAEPALPVESFQAQFESAKRFGALAGPGRGTFRDRFEDIKKRAFLKTGQLQGATGKLIRLTRRQQQAVVENPALLAEFHGRRPRRAIAFAAGPASPVAFDFSGIRSLTHALARQHHCMDRLEYYIGICDRHLPGQEVRSRLNQMFAAYNNADSSHREALIEKNSRFDPLRNRFLKDPETLALLTARVDLIAQYFGEHDVARPSHEHVAKQARTLRIQLSRLGQIERLFARIKETYEECRTVFYPRIDLRLSKSENFLSQLVFLMRQIKKHEPLLHKANRADRQSLIDLQRDLDIAIRHPSLYASLKRKWLAPKPSETLPDAAELLHAGGEGIRF